MSDVKLKSDDIRTSLKAQLQHQLAEATTLVWKMQNATTDPMSTNELANCQELVKYAQALNERASVILGHVSRWELWESDHGDLPATKNDKAPTSKRFPPTDHKFTAHRTYTGTGCAICGLEAEAHTTPEASR